MAITTPEAVTRLRTFLMDSDPAQIWTDTDLQQGLRMALGDFSARAGEAVTLSGLDGAGATTVPAAGEAALILGGGAYAALSRSLDRAESYELANEGEDVHEWAKETLGAFREVLGLLYPGTESGEGSAAWQTADNQAKLARLQLELETQAAIAQANQTAETTRTQMEIDARAAAAAALAAREDATRAAEAARAATLRTEAVNPPWGVWGDD